MRSTTTIQADLALMLLPMLSSLPESYVRDVMSRFLDSGDATQFGLGNTLTSLARDTPEPEQRWRLEEMGGGLLVPVAPVPSTDDACARAVMA